MLELRGGCWRLLGEHFGVLGAASEALRGPFVDHFEQLLGVIFEYMFHVSGVFLWYLCRLVDRFGVDFPWIFDYMFMTPD